MTITINGTNFCPRAAAWMDAQRLRDSACYSGIGRDAQTALAAGADIDDTMAAATAARDAQATEFVASR